MQQFKKLVLCLSVAPLYLIAADKPQSAAGAAAKDVERKVEVKEREEKLTEAEQAERAKRLRKGLRKLPTEIFEKIFEYLPEETYEFVAEHNGFGDPIISATWSLDGTRIFFVTNREVRSWDIATGRVITILHCDNPYLHILRSDERIISAAWTLGAKRVAIGYENGAIKIINTETGCDVRVGQLEKELQRGHTRNVASLAWNSNGTRLASGSWDHTIKIWDIVNRRVVVTLQAGTNFDSLVWSPDDTLIASGSVMDASIRIWNAITEQIAATLQGHRWRVASVAWNPEGTRLASGSVDETIKIWNIATRQVIATLPGHKAMVESVAWNPDGIRLASGSRDGTVKIWNVNTNQLIKTLQGHRHPADIISSVAWSSDGTQIAAGSPSGTIKVWSALYGTMLAARQREDAAELVRTDAMHTKIKNNILKYLHAGETFKTKPKLKKLAASYPAPYRQAVIQYILENLQQVPPSQQAKNKKLITLRKRYPNFYKQAYEQFEQEEHKIMLQHELEEQGHRSMVEEAFRSGSLKV